MSSQLLKQSASGGASEVFVSNDLVVAGQSTFNGLLNGPQSLKCNARFIQMGDYSNGGVSVPQTPPDFTTPVPTWVVNWDGTTNQVYVYTPATNAIYVLNVVVPADFLTNDAKYLGKELLRIWAQFGITGISNSTSITIQYHLGSPTGTQIGRQVLNGASSTGYFSWQLNAVPKTIATGAQPYYNGIVSYVIGGAAVSPLPPT
jgi:hypothetical protein